MKTRTRIFSAALAAALATTTLTGIAAPCFAQSQYADVESYYIFGTKYYDEFYEDLDIDQYEPESDEFCKALRAADYYRIAWEADAALRRDPEGDNPYFAQDAWLDWKAQGDGTFSLKMRLMLREAVYTFGLDKGLIPYDREFWLDTTKMRNVGTATGNSGGSTYNMAEGMRFNRAWLISRGVDVAPPMYLTSMEKPDGTRGYYDDITDSYFDTPNPSKEEYEVRYAEWKAEYDAKNAENDVNNTPATNGNFDVGTVQPNNPAINEPAAGGDVVDTPNSSEQPSSENETVAIAESAFADVPMDSWYGEAVNKMVESGLIKGKDDGLFHPDDVMTVGELCQILYRLTYSNINENWSTYTSKGVHLSHWSAPAIDACRLYGYTQMEPCITTDGTWTQALSIPDNLPGEITPVQRGEAINAVIEILKDAGLLDSTVSPSFSWNDIPDAEAVLAGVEPCGYYFYNGQPSYWKTHYWDSDNILTAYQLRITTGVDHIGTFNPTGILTRAQACKLLYNAGLDHHLNLYSKSSYPTIIGSF